MDEHDPLTGHTLENRYLIGQRLAGGRVGGVYRAEDLRGERDVAVRVIAAGGLDADARARLRAAFRSEARTAVRVSHPHLVQALDYGSDDRLEIHYLVTELLEPFHLGAYLRKFGPPPLAGAVALALQAARGLAAAHAAGLVHRDVRPRSILLVDGGGGEASARLVDFARVDGGAGAGTGYAAPEHRAGEPATPASDVFALAVTALETLTGRAPVAAEGAPRLLLDAARGLPTPEPVLDALVAALSPDPRDRPRDARDFVAALEAAAAEAGIVPAPPRLQPRRAARRAEAAAEAVPATVAAAPKPPPSTARPMAAAAAMVLVVAGGAMAVLLAGGDEATPSAGAAPPPGLATPAASEGAAEARTIAPGQTVTARFGRGEPLTDDRSHYHLWRLDARAGERLVVDMRSSDVDSYLVWGSLDGGRWEERGSDDDSGVGRDALLRFTVPASGEYGIRATTFSRGEQGAYTLSVEALPALAAVPVQVGQTVQGTFSAGDAVDDEGSYHHLYLVRGAPGERIVVDMRSGDFDAFLVGGRLEGASFQPLVRDDDGGRGTDARLVVELDAGGRYGIVARTYNARRTGSYTLSVRSRD